MTRAGAIGFIAEFLVTGLALLVVSAPGCSRKPASLSSATSASGAPAEPVSVEPNIRDILSEFENGNEPEAVRMFLEIASWPGGKARIAAMRVSELSEVEFRKQYRELSPEQGARLQQGLLDQFQSIRRFTRHVLALASESKQAGNPERANALIAALERLADSNTGQESEVTLLSNVIGKKIGELAANAASTPDPESP